MDCIHSCTILALSLSKNGRGYVVQSVAYLTEEPEEPGLIAGQALTFVSPSADSRRAVSGTGKSMCAYS